jgi:hypothetical protein
MRDALEQLRVEMVVVYRRVSLLLFMCRCLLSLQPSIEAIDLVLEVLELG